MLRGANIIFKELIHKMLNSRYLSHWNLYAGFWQIWTVGNDRPMTVSLLSQFFRLAVFSKLPNGSLAVSELAVSELPVPLLLIFYLCNIMRGSYTFGMGNIFLKIIIIIRASAQINFLLFFFSNAYGKYLLKNKDFL